MSNKEFIVILNEILLQMRSFNAQIKSINETLDKILQKFESFEERSPLLQETLSK